VRVSVTGTLGDHSVDRFDAAVRERISARDVLAVVDVSGVEVADRAGLVALDALRRGTASSRRHVVVRGVSAAADEVIRFDRVLRQLRSQRSSTVATAAASTAALANRAG
jgi:anti-anti-sigma regulatory factor